MHNHLPWVAGLVLASLPVARSQLDDPLGQIVSQAISVYTDVRSKLDEQATATSASTESTSTTSALTSTSSSTFSTSTIPSTSSTQSASNTAEAAAASSSATAAVAAANSENGKTRTTAIVLGVVLGLLALVAVIGLLFFCLRRRRRRRAVESRRSLSPEAVDGVSWGKGRSSTSSTAGHATPGRRSTNEHHHAPVGAAAPLMAEKDLNRDSENGASDGSAHFPQRGAPTFQPDLMNASSASQRPHQTGHDHTPLSSHSQSGLAAAGLGGAALGGLAAKHHNKHGKHENQNSAVDHQPNAHRHSLSRKPVAGNTDHGTTEHAPNTDVANDVAPEYHARHSDLPHNDATNSSQHTWMSAGTGSRSPFHNGNPPAYNGNGHPLSSHPPLDQSHRHSIGHHEPLTAGAAGVGAAAVGGAARAKNHEGGRTQDSSLTGRHSWDPNRQPQRPQSILASSNGRRSSGSTNPYVQARSPRRARFSDDVTQADGDAHSEHKKHDRLPQDSPYPRMEHQETSQPRSSVSNDAPSQPTPRPSMPGGWRGSGQFDRYSPRGSFSNESPATGPAVSAKHRNPSLSDLRQEEEEDSWYRGRHMGGDNGATAATEPGRSSYDQRFYANHSGKVGQAL